MKRLLPLLFLLSALCGQDYERIGPREPREEPPKIEDDFSSCSDEVLIDELVGIYVVSSETERGAREGVHIVNLNLSRKQEMQISHTLRKYLGSPLTSDRLDTIRSTIIRFFNEIHKPFVAVTVPEQDITDGILTFEVLEGTLGKVSVEGNKYFSKEQYKRYIRLTPGGEIQTDTLISDIAWINRNPFRSANAVFAPGEKPGTTNIDLVVKDSKPYRAYVGTDNTGFEETGLERLFAGINIGRLFGSSQVLSYQFTASSDFNKFLSHSGRYTIPLPWRNELVFFGGYSRVRTSRVAHAPIRSKGNSVQASGRYVIPLPAWGSVLTELKFGPDWKRTNNTLTVGGDRSKQKNVNILQFFFGFDITARTRCIMNEARLGAYVSPGQWLPNMSDKRFAQLRTGANSHYAYFTTELEQLYFLPHDWTLLTKLEGHFSTSDLLPSEQMGLGGFYSIRGYRERVVNADNGMLLTIEPRTPTAHVKTKIGDHSFQYILFADFGIGGGVLDARNHRGTQFLLGVGPGLRYNLSTYIVGRADWGFQIFKVRGLTAKRNRFNFRLTASY